jgi:hypothetical protein
MSFLFFEIAFGKFQLPCFFSGFSALPQGSCEIGKFAEGGIKNPNAASA